MTAFQHRQACAWRAFYARSEVWRSAGASPDKLRVFRQTVEPCMQLGSESWNMRKSERRTLDFALWRMLRKILARKRHVVNGMLECWLTWWRRTGHLAQECWKTAGFLPWSTRMLTR
eukprot:2942058-Heterocapsa_arctica.AAC.1